MISSNPQDEGMLSERNEQDLFNSGQNSLDGYSDNGSNSDGEYGEDNGSPIDELNYGDK
jgi:hypothetical protein